MQIFYNIFSFDRIYCKAYYQVVTKHPLSQYVIAVIAVLVLVNTTVYFVLGKAKFFETAKYSLAFLLGMLAMYIAVHIYQWK